MFDIQELSDPFQLPAAAKLVALESSNSNYHQMIRIEWFLGMNCNLNCSYCVEHDRSQEFASYAQIKKGIDLLAQKIAQKRHFLLLGGGEPALHPDIEKIVRYMGEKRLMVGMITNGTHSRDLYIRMLEFIKDYTFSLHFETDSWKKSLDNIIAVKEAITLSGLDVWNLNVHLMMSHEHFDEADLAASILKTNNIHFIYRPIRANAPDEQIGKTLDVHEQSYINEKLFTMRKTMYEYWETKNRHILRIASNPNDILIRNLHHFAGWKCWVGLERLHIYPQGDVYRSTCLVGGMLGNIFKDFALPDIPVVCTNPKCTCAWAIDLSKVVHEDYMPLLGTSFKKDVF